MNEKSEGLIRLALTMAREARDVEAIDTAVRERLEEAVLALQSAANMANGAAARCRNQSIPAINRKRSEIA